MTAPLAVVVLLVSAIACAHSPAPKGVSVSDRDQIATTVTNVSHFIDHKQWPELRGLYADEVETDYTSLFGGEVMRQPGDALIAGWKKLLTPIITQHHFGPLTVEIDGASAIVRCHVRGYHVVKGAAGGDEWMVAAHYIFRLAQVGSSWKISAMKIDVFYQDGNTKLLEVAGGR